MGGRAAVASAVAVVVALPVAWGVARAGGGPADSAGERPPAGTAEQQVTPAPSLPPYPDCTVRMGRRHGSLELDEAQAANATTLIAWAARTGAADRLLHRGLQRVLDEDSTRFLRTARVRNFLAGSPRTAPSRATLRLARALDGSHRAALTCRHTRAGDDERKMRASGLTPRAQRLRRAMLANFGPMPMGGFAPGGISTGHVDNSAHYEGRAIDVFFQPRTAENRRAGWRLANWLVAHARRYSVLAVIYDDRIWTVWASSLGWRRYEHPSGNTSNPVLRHLDHVHVAVVGGPWRGD